MHIPSVFTIYRESSLLESDLQDKEQPSLRHVYVVTKEYCSSLALSSLNLNYPIHLQTSRMKHRLGFFILFFFLVPQGGRTTERPSPFGVHPRVPFAATGVYLSFCSGPYHRLSGSHRAFVLLCFRSWDGSESIVLHSITKPLAPVVLDTQGVAV